MTATVTTTLKDYLGLSLWYAQIRTSGSGSTSGTGFNGRTEQEALSNLMEHLARTDKPMTIERVIDAMWAREFESVCANDSLTEWYQPAIKMMEAM